MSGASAHHLPPAIAKPLTRPETPCLATKHRATQHTESAVAGEVDRAKKFEAQRLNPAILQGPVRLLHYGPFFG